MTNRVDQIIARCTGLSGHILDAKMDLMGIVFYDERCDSRAFHDRFNTRMQDNVRALAISKPLVTVPPECNQIRYGPELVVPLASLPSVGEGELVEMWSTYHGVVSRTRPMRLITTELDNLRQEAFWKTAYEVSSFYQTMIPDNQKLLNYINRAYRIYRGLQTD